MTVPAERPSNEAERLQRLHELDVLDSPAEQVFDSVAQLAAAACQVPIALVCMVDAERQWFKANIGLDGVAETPRDVAFCAHAILKDEVMVVGNAATDARFSTNPLVTGDPAIRFYAGAPIQLESGHRVGTVCVIDRVPRELDAAQLLGLHRLAELTAQSLDMRDKARQEALARKSAHERDLGVREAMYRAIVEDQSELVCLSDREGRLTFVNGAYGRHFGLAPEQLVGAHLLAQVPAEHREAAAEHLRQVALVDGPSCAEQPIVHRDGRPGWIAWSDRALRDDRGQFIGVHSVGRDVTEQRTVQQQLARARADLQIILDNVPALIGYWGHDLCMRFANRAYETLYGRPQVELPGLHMREVLGESAYSVSEPYALAALAGRRQSFERSATYLDGAPMHSECVFIPDEQGGEVRGIFALVTDITQRKLTEQRLRDNERLLARTGRLAGVGGWQVDLRSKVLTWTEQTRLMHEVTDEFVPTVTTAMDFYHPDDRHLIEQAVQRGLTDGSAWNVELRLITAKGRTRWVHTTGEVEYAGSEPIRMLGAFQDITSRKQAERALREQHELLRVTLKSIGDAVITTDAHGRVTWLNPIAEQLTGWTNVTASGRMSSEVFRIVHVQSRDPAPDPVALCLSSASPMGGSDRKVLLACDGAEYGVEDSASPIRDEEGHVLGAVLVFHDVSAQRRMNDEMTFRATHDQLTGLVNRSEFDARLRRVLEKMRSETDVSALMFIDLDQFKLVNDACGHASGDQLLRQVSAMLGKCVRSRDTLARLGGDEFGVILEHCTVEQAHRVAQSICDEMDDFRFVHGGRRFRIGTSIGLVPVDSRWSNAMAVHKAADTACYAAKAAGRNRVHTWIDTDVVLLAREGETQWGSTLEQAIDDDGFVLYAQRVGGLCSSAQGLHCEVLLRLVGADGRIIAPGVFLPAAERFHMASRIDRWVVQRVLLWLQAQGEATSDIETIAVNLSGQSIGDRAFHRYVAQLLTDIPVDRKKLCFEVTETAAITNLADAAAFIDEMRRLGVRIALDDFGAGASSFGYLKTLAVDYLKIDGQFVRDIETDPLNMAAVRCFHDVARAIGVQTIAEFVETDGIRHTLRGIGIDFEQGYLLHRPEPLDALLLRYRNENAAVIS